MSQLKNLFKQRIHGHNALDAVAVHVHLKAIRSNQRGLDVFLVLGGSQECIYFIPQLGIIILVYGKVTTSEFHLAQIHHTICPVNKHVYLSAWYLSICSRSPGIYLSLNAGNTKRGSNLLLMDKANILKGDSPPTVELRGRLIVSPEMWIIGGILAAILR